MSNVQKNILESLEFRGESSNFALCEHLLLINIEMTTRYKYTPSRQECETIFVASCVESAARECGVTADAMYERMSRIHLITEYILPCYDVLHSESRKNVTADILKTMEMWENRLNEHKE